MLIFVRPKHSSRSYFVGGKDLTVCVDLLSGGIHFNTVVTIQYNTPKAWVLKSEHSGVQADIKTYLVPQSTLTAD